MSSAEISEQDEPFRNIKGVFGQRVRKMTQFFTRYEIDASGLMKEKHVYREKVLRAMTKNWWTEANLKTIDDLTVTERESAVNEIIKRFITENEDATQEDKETIKTVEQSTYARILELIGNYKPKDDSMNVDITLGPRKNKAKSPSAPSVAESKQAEDALAVSKRVHGDGNGTDESVDNLTTDPEMPELVTDSEDEEWERLVREDMNSEWSGNDNDKDDTKKSGASYGDDHDSDAPEEDDADATGAAAGRADVGNDALNSMKKGKGNKNKKGKDKNKKNVKNNGINMSALEGLKGAFDKKNQKKKKKKKKNKQNIQTRKKGLTQNKSDDDSDATTATTATLATEATDITEPVEDIDPELLRQQEEERAERERIASEMIAKQGYVNYMKNTTILGRMNKFTGLLEERRKKKILEPMSSRDKYWLHEGRDGCRDHNCRLQTIPCDYDHVMAVCSKGHVFRFHHITDSQMQEARKESSDKTHGVCQCWTKVIKRAHEKWGLDGFDEENLETWLTDQNLTHDTKCFGNVTRLWDDEDNEEAYYTQYDEKTGVPEERKDKDDVRNHDCDGTLYCVYRINQGQVECEYLGIPDEAETPFDNLDQLINPDTADDKRIADAKKLQETKQKRKEADEAAAKAKKEEKEAKQREIEEEAKKERPRFPSLCKNVFELYQSDSKVIEEINEKVKAKARQKNDVAAKDHIARQFKGTWQSMTAQNKENYHAAARKTFDNWQNAVELYLDRMNERADEKYKSLTRKDSDVALGKLREKMVMYNVQKSDAFDAEISQFVTQLDLYDDLGHKRKLEQLNAKNKKKGRQNNNNKKGRKNEEETRANKEKAAQELQKRGENLDAFQGLFDKRARQDAEKKEQEEQRKRDEKARVARLREEKKKNQSQNQNQNQNRNPAKKNNKKKYVKVDLNDLNNFGMEGKKRVEVKLNDLEKVLDQEATSQLNDRTRSLLFDILGPMALAITCNQNGQVSDYRDKWESMMVIQGKTGMEDHFLRYTRIKILLQKYLNQWQQLGIYLFPSTLFWGSPEFENQMGNNVTLAQEGCIALYFTSNDLKLREEIYYLLDKYPNFFGVSGLDDFYIKPRGAQLVFDVNEAFKYINNQKILNLQKATRIGADVAQLCQQLNEQLPVPGDHIDQVVWQQSQRNSPVMPQMPQMPQMNQMPRNGRMPGVPPMGSDTDEKAPASVPSSHWQRSQPAVNGNYAMRMDDDDDDDRYSLNTNARHYDEMRDDMSDAATLDTEAEDRYIGSDRLKSSPRDDAKESVAGDAVDAEGSGYQQDLFSDASSVSALSDATIASAASSLSSASSASSFTNSSAASNASNVSSASTQISQLSRDWLSKDPIVKEYTDVILKGASLFWCIPRTYLKPTRYVVFLGPKSSDEAVAGWRKNLLKCADDLGRGKIDYHEIRMNGKPEGELGRARGYKKQQGYIFKCRQDRAYATERERNAQAVTLLEAIKAASEKHDFDKEMDYVHEWFGSHYCGKPALKKRDNSKKKSKEAKGPFNHTDAGEDYQSYEKWLEYYNDQKDKHGKKVRAVGDPSEASGVSSASGASGASDSMSSVSSNVIPGAPPKEGAAGMRTKIGKDGEKSVVESVSKSSGSGSKRSKASKSSKSSKASKAPSVGASVVSEESVLSSVSSGVHLNDDVFVVKSVRKREFFVVKDKNSLSCTVMDQNGDIRNIRRRELEICGENPLHVLSFVQQQELGRLMNRGEVHGEDEQSLHREEGDDDAEDENEVEDEVDLD